MDNQFNSPEYKRYRKAYVTQCTVEHLVGLLVADAFLATLLKYLGLSDAMTGVISSFASVAFVFQLMQVFLVQSKFSTKKIVMLFDVLSQLLFAFIYFVPFVPIDSNAKKLIVVASIMISQVCKTMVITLYYKWGNSYVEDEKRAQFSAMKECISLITGIVFVAVVSFVFDKFKAFDNTEGGLLFIACTMAVLNVANYISFALIKDEPKRERESMRVPTKEVIGHIASNKIFRNYVLINMFGATTGAFISGFLGVYKIQELGMSLFLVQVINIVADFFRMGVSMPFANYSAKHGFARGIFLASLILLIGKVCIVFTTPATWWLIIVYTLCTAAYNAGSYQNSFNIGYTLLPQKYMVQGMSVSRTATGIISFISAIMGGKILSIVQANGNMVFGIHMYGQQLLAILSILVVVPVLILKYKFVIKPLDKILAEKNAEAAQNA